MRVRWLLVECNVQTQDMRSMSLFPERKRIKMLRPIIPSSSAVCGGGYRREMSSLAIWFNLPPLSNLHYNCLLPFPRHLNLLFFFQGPCTCESSLSNSRLLYQIAKSLRPLTSMKVQLQLSLAKLCKNRTLTNVFYYCFSTISVFTHPFLSAYF